MKKIIYINMKKVFLLIVMSLSVFTSCRNRVVPNVGTLDLRISGLDEYMVVETKSAVDYTDVNNYDVVIDGPTKYEAKFSKMTGEVVELGSGSYTITVTSPSTEPVAFEQPIYQAYEEFVIKAGEVTPLDLVCTPLNCKVTIEEIIFMLSRTMRIAQHLEQIAVWVTWAAEEQVRKGCRQTKREPPDCRQRRRSCCPQGCGLTCVVSGGSSDSWWS